VADQGTWQVRHIHSSTDRAMGPYLREMTTTLTRWRQTGRIERLASVPVHSAGSIKDALYGVQPDELLIVDLHGDATDTRLHLSASGESGSWFELTSLPGSAIAASVVVLGGCTSLWKARAGAWNDLHARLVTLLGRSTTLFANFDVASQRDHTPIYAVNALLSTLSDPDPKFALGPLQKATGSGQWFADLLDPSARHT
jgi:hypothetical protein